MTEEQIIGQVFLDQNNKIDVTYDMLDEKSKKLYDSGLSKNKFSLSLGVSSTGNASYSIIENIELKQIQGSDK